MKTSISQHIESFFCFLPDVCVAFLLFCSLQSGSLERQF